MRTKGVCYDAEPLHTYDVSNICLGRSKTRKVQNLFTSIENRMIIRQILKLVFNLLGPELFFFLILAHPVYKM